MFKSNFSGNNIILWGTKEIGGLCPRKPLRGYEPAGSSIHSEYDIKNNYHR